LAVVGGGSLRRVGPTASVFEIDRSPFVAPRHGRHAWKETLMSDSLSWHVLGTFWCIVVLCLGCNRATDQAQISRDHGTKPDPARVLQAVAEKSQAKDRVNEPKGKNIHQGHSFNLESLFGSEGSVHIYFLQQPPVAGEKPFFVVWTDARMYAGGTGYPADQNIPPRKNLVDGDLRLRYGGKDNDFDREVECSFEITVGEHGRLKVDGITYDFTKGALFLVSGQDGNVRVKQLSRDSSLLPVDRDTVAAFAMSDPDIKEFVSKAAKLK
jgi:hypothetical protein